MWKSSGSDSNHPTATEDPPTSAPPTSAVSGTPASSRRAAVIGPSITIKGDLSGEEDLVIEGQVEGEVVLRKHMVVIGSGGRLKADVHGQKIHVEGQIEGNLLGEQEVIIRKSGRVSGNITAPRVTLEDGCKFRGNVDMNPRPTREVQAGAMASAPSSKRKGKSSHVVKSPATATPATAKA